MIDIDLLVSNSPQTEKNSMTCGPVLSFEAEKALIEQLAQLTDGHLQCLIHEANLQKERTRVSRYLAEVSPEQVEEIVRQSHNQRERHPNDTPTDNPPSFTVHTTFVAK